MQKIIGFTVKGNPTSKKNSSQIITIQGRPRLIPSKQYKEFEKVFLPQVPEAAKLKITYPVTLKCVYFRETKRVVDLTNLLAATCDLLVKAGVIADDCCQIVYSHDGSRVYYDKENPRTEITIIPQAYEKES